MYRLLVVDDEPIIVEGIFELLQSVESMDLDIYRAFNAQQALEWISRYKMDIVLSDIRMPGLSGLDLQQEIRMRWPSCKIIFLTGFKNFDYAQTAVRQGVVDYILKTEGDERILAAVERAIEATKRELEEKDLLQNVRRKMEEAMPLLIQDFMTKLLNGDDRTLQQLSRRFAELNLPCDPAQPVLMVLGRVERWREGMLLSDQTLFEYAIENIVGEYVSSFLHHISVKIGQYYVWFVQPKIGADSPLAGREWSEAVQFTKGAMESVQNSCAELLNISISLAVGGTPDPWQRISESFGRLSRLLSLRRSGFGEQFFLLDTPEDQQLQQDYGSIFTHMDLIRRLHTFILQNLNADLSLTRLAEFVYLNPSYLSRLYKQVTGIRLFDHIDQVRLDKARELLRENVLKIHEIGAAVGYESAPYFSRFFKKHTGISPQEFRETSMKC